MDKKPVIVGVLAVVVIASGAAAALSVSYFVSGGSNTYDTADGEVVISGEAAGDLHAVEGPWFNTTIRNIGAAGVSYNPGDKTPIFVDGGLDELNYSQIGINDGEVDIRYNASAQVNITLTKLPPNVTLELVNESNTTVATNTTSDDGVASWIVSSGTETTSIRADSPSDIAPLNENASVPDTGNWTGNDTNATLSTIGGYLSRIPSVAVGGTGLGASGALVLGVLVAVGVISIPSSVGGGPVAGAVAGVAAIASVVSLGLAPEWLYAIVLFVLGAVGSAVVVRLWR